MQQQTNQGVITQEQLPSVALIPAPRLNALIVAAPVLRMDEVNADIAKLDVDNTQIAKDFHLHRASALTRLATLLKQLLQHALQRRRRVVGQSSGPHTFDTPINTVFVQAAPADMKEIEALIDHLEADESAAHHDLVHLASRPHRGRRHRHAAAAGHQLRRRPLRRADGHDHGHGDDLRRRRHFRRLPAWLAVASLGGFPGGYAPAEGVRAAGRPAAVPPAGLRPAGPRPAGPRPAGPRPARPRRPPPAPSPRASRSRSPIRRRCSSLAVRRAGGRVHPVGREQQQPADSRPGEDAGPADVPIDSLDVAPAAQYVVKVVTLERRGCDRHGDHAATTLPRHERHPLPRATAPPATAGTTGAPGCGLCGHARRGRRRHLRRGRRRRPA